MRESFFKAFKWYIIAICAIIGTSAFIIADKSGSVKPVMIGVLSYGVVYAMSHFWKEFRGKLLLTSMIIFLILSFASPYIPYLMYILFAYNPESFDPYYTWGVTMAVFGIPAMTLAFYKLD